MSRFADQFRTCFATRVYTTLVVAIQVVHDLEFTEDSREGDGEDGTLFAGTCICGGFDPRPPSSSSLFGFALPFGVSV